MILFICAQDIKFFWSGLIENDKFLTIQKYNVEPDNYLDCIQKLLDKNNLSIKNIQGVSIVTGPGSFTASRVSITIANAASFASNARLFVLENPDKFSPDQLIHQKGIGEPLEKGMFALPVYDRPPNITIRASVDDKLDILRNKC